jgi:hypothetical protein
MENLESIIWFLLHLLIIFRRLSELNKNQYIISCILQWTAKLLENVATVFILGSIAYFIQDT